jgi:hypothetical protein
MSAGAQFLLERVSVPGWLGDVDQDDAYVLFGEQREWGFTLPWLYQGLAKPKAHRPMLRAPQSGDDFWPCALGYWTPLLHLLVYGLGWTRPDLGLRWWFDAGKPANDRRLAMLSEVWDADGQLDWFAAWLWTGGRGRYLPRRHDLSDERRVEVDHAWLRWVEQRIEESAAPAPYGGGYDPLHLAAHIEGPLQGDRVRHAGTLRPNGGGRHVLELESMTGWYRELVEAGTVFHSGDPGPVRVEVIVQPVGRIGIYERSSVTGLWFSCRHNVHLAGN